MIGRWRRLPCGAVSSQAAEIHQALLQLFHSSHISSPFRNIPVSRQHRCDVSQRCDGRPERKRPGFHSAHGLLRSSLCSSSGGDFPGKTCTRNIRRAIANLIKSHPRPPVSAGRKGQGADGREAILAEETGQERKTAKEEMKGAQGHEKGRKRPKQMTRQIHGARRSEARGNTRGTSHSLAF